MNVPVVVLADLHRDVEVILSTLLHGHTSHVDHVGWRLGHLPRLLILFVVLKSILIENRLLHLTSCYVLKSLRWELLVELSGLPIEILFLLSSILGSQAK